jgi:pyruvate dehydrogenase E2 component (dihydrolipoamide acetyltransferase)
MATKVYMEALSPTMEEGRLVTWLKAEGDEVKEGDVLAEVETDKATMELVARGSGVLRKRLLDEGGTAKVGDLIGVVAGADEDVSALIGGGGGGAAKEPAPKAEEKTEAKPAEKAEAKPAAEDEEAEEEPAETPAAGAPAEAPSGGRVKSSPLARRMAKEGGIDIGGVRGSGPGGRIVRRDVEEAVAAKGGAPADAAAPAAARQPAAQPTGDARYREHPLSQMRKTIARRLTQSIGPVPHFFLTVEADMGEAMRLRGRINERFAADGVKASPNDLIIKAVAMALKRHPFVNAAWTDSAIRLYEQVHIGVAVAVDEGLITPVIRDADLKGVADIAREVKELAGRAREKKLKPEEYTGSTFSISNLGMFGIDEFTAVINPPEAAILAVGAIAPKVVVDGEGNMAVRQRMRMTLSCDHRVIDGATGAAFLQTLVGFLEEPMLMIA